MCDYHQNMDSLNKITNYVPRWLLITAAIFFAMVIILFTPYWLFGKKYHNRIYPGIYAGDLNLSGKTREEARDLLNKELDKYYQSGIIFYLNGARFALFPTVASAETDFSYNIINFNAEQTIKAAFAAGRKTSFLKAAKALAGKKIFINLSYSADEEEINKILAQNFSQYEIPARNAELISDNGNFEIKAEEIGATIDYGKAIARLKTNLARLDNAPIELFTRTAYPEILKKDCLNIEAKASRVLDNSPLTLIYNAASSSAATSSADKISTWDLNKNTIAEWLSLVPSVDAEEKISVSLNREAVKKYLKETVAPSINKSPEPAKFEFKNGKVTEFKTGQTGIELDVEAALTEIIKSANGLGAKEINLAVKEISGGINAEDANNFNIKEIIGIGKSNFTGSPANRRHNIKNGAGSVNGVLIKPDEEFSLVKTLGKIDAASGYLPELVIKGNKTVPEYGGGLCQIGTTMFRAALDSGLPITMRQNHSYRVTYYEPAGTDATIYDPKPDLKFINDTQNYILIQTKIEGNDLYFYFWGAKDGRTVEKTDPTIYNIVKPGPAKLVETLDLAPGKKKCTEKAHNGADAFFDYKVAYANGDIKEKRFSSHYIPWREVCLIGVEKLTTATSTDAIKN